MANEHQKTTQAVVVNMPNGPVEHQTTEKFALFVESGGSLVDYLADLEARVFALENP